MEFVHRTVTITPEQEAFLANLKKAGVSYSLGVRLALDLLREQKNIVVPADTTHGVRVITVSVQEMAS